MKLEYKYIYSGINIQSFIKLKNLILLDKRMLNKYELLK